jgi:hypothetical protein
MKSSIIQMVRFNADLSAAELGAIIDRCADVVRSTADSPVLTPDPGTV